jgi:hypothetical protein
MNADSLNQRGILKGVQCICGQWWPDFIRTDHAMQMRTECCGSLYQLMTGMGTHRTLSLIEDNFTKREVPVL